MDAEENGFNAAICHYFLWRAASAQRAATAAPSETNGNRNSAASASSTQCNRENKGARYQQLAELMLQHFPMLRAPLVLPPIPPPTVKPQVLEQFSTFPTLHQEALYLRSRCQALELNCYELQRKLKNSNTNGKSKDPPAAAANATANGRLAYTMATASTTSRTSARKKPNDKQSKLASQSVVPDDVKEYINQLEHEKLNNKRTIDHLQNKVLQAMGTDTSKEAPEAPPLPPPTPVVVQPNKKRRYIPKEKDLSWEEQLQQLEHFAKGNGHCRVPTEQSQLGTFVRELRRNYRNLQALDESKRNEILSRTPTRANHLSHERLAKLKELGFEWRAAPSITSFEERIEQLFRYKKEHGDLMVPKRYDEIRSLGLFVQEMRKRYKQKHPWLMGEREEKLNAIGFVWDTNTSRKIPFSERLEECQAFRRKHGHLNVPPLDKDEKSEIPEEERSFRLWCNRARGYYRQFQANQQSRLDKGQIKKLDEMGFDWGPLTSVRRKKLNDKEDSVAPERQVLKPANVTSSSDESHGLG